MYEINWNGMAGNGLFKGKTTVKFCKLKGALTKWNVDAGNILEKRII